ncbi:hypothetical protein [Micromonospora sp. NPDC048843]|uniref:hypothetical protein n=1 Tax=Micromonospora sp. NPDC048843 TaxID=3155389 RepID=UPI0033D1D112
MLTGLDTPTLLAGGAGPDRPDLHTEATFTVGADLTASLHQLAREQRVTLSTVLQAS